MKPFLSALILFVFSLGFSQTIDPSAKITLEEVRKNVDSKANLQIKFVYELNNPKQKIKQKENGVIYNQGEKYNLTILGVNQIYDGKSLYQISNEDQEITISKSNSDEVITPNKIFDNYKTGYTISKPTNGKVGNQVVQLIKLVPTDAKNKAKDITLAINIKQKQLVRMVENNKDGSIITLKVLSFDYKTVLKPTLFSFDKTKYKGFIITDLR